MSLRPVAYALGTLAGLALLAAVVFAVLTVGVEHGVLSIESTPPRASAFLDGRFVGTTPLSVSDCPGGTHVLRLVRFGYASAVRELDVRPGKGDVRVSLVELPGGLLAIKSTPSGADVAVDGEPRGQTPLTLKDLGTGGHPVRVTLVNYLDWIGFVEIEEGRVASLDISLQSRTEAHFLEAIRLNPKDAGYQAEFAHFNVARGEWQKAEDAIAAGLTLVAKEPESAQYMQRMFQEMDKIFQGQFKYENVRRGQETVLNATIRAVKACPKYDLYYGMALTYADQLAMTDKARDVVETGILAFPSSQNWAIQAVNRRFVEGNPDRLLVRLDALLKTNPQDFVARYQRIAVLRQKGRTDDAIADYELIISQSRTPAVTSRLLADLGALYERKTNPEKAAESYAKALENAPGKKEQAPILYKNLIPVLTSLKRTDEALAAWEKAVAAQDDEETACRWRLEWVQALINAERLDKARSVLGDVLSISKDDRTLNQAKELLRHVEK